MKTKTSQTKKESFIYGYKALDKNLCAIAGNGMRFEIGKTYEVDGDLGSEGDLEFYENGFHFCESLEDTCHYPDPSEQIRFVKIKAYGEVLPGDDDFEFSKPFCRKIKVVKELSDKEILKILELSEKSLTEEEVFNKSVRVKNLLILKRFFLEILVNDKDPYVRCAVAKQKYGLETLVKDKDWVVRRTVAQQKYGLGILVNDEDELVRCAVAQQKYGLDVLVNDEDPYVSNAAQKILSSIKQSYI